MTNFYRTFLAVVVLSFTILTVAGDASADEKSKAPPPPPPPPTSTNPPRTSDLGAKLQFQLNEANSIYNKRSSSGGAGNVAGTAGRVGASKAR